MNIYQKLIEVRKTIDAFTKDSKSFGYTYVSGSQILSKIKGKMDELGIILQPHIKQDEVTHEIFQYVTKDKNGKEKNNIDYIVKAPLTYEWINAEKPEDRICIEWYMLGQQDEISKAFGSGLTYAERYFLLKYFGVPTDDEDPDTKPPKGAPGNPQGNKPRQNTISDSQQKRLFALANGNVELAKKVLSKYKYASSADVLKTDYDKICKEIEQGEK